MLVRKVKGGYKYGQKGKVYKRKSDALKQGKAIQSNKKEEKRENNYNIVTCILILYVVYYIM